MNKKEKEEYRKFLILWTGKQISFFKVDANEAEIIIAFYNYKNAKLTNKKLKNESWKIPVWILLGWFIGIISPIATEWIRLKLKEPMPIIKSVQTSSPLQKK